jgi:hypothetical protein
MEAILKKSLLIITIILLLSFMTPLVAVATVDCHICGRDEMRCPRMNFIKLTEMFYGDGCEVSFFLYLIFFSGVIALFGIPVIFIVVILRKRANKRISKPVS